MPEEIGLFEAIYTQRAVRAFKPDPVPDEVIHKLIEAATKAPSGSNRQGWKFLVIRDVELKRKIGEYYNLARESRYGGGAAPVSNVPPRRQAASNYMAEHMHEVPVLILACIEHDGGPSTMSRGGSIYPAVQNLLLAARGLGLVLAQPDRRVLVITGDGEMLMGMGSLATIAIQAPKNLAIVVFDNERYGETGMQPTHTAYGADLAGAAESLGFSVTGTVLGQGELTAALPVIREAPGPVFFSIKVRAEELDFVLPANDGVVLRDRFRKALLGP